MKPKTAPSLSTEPSDLAALVQIPTISLVMPHSDIFGEGGIYVNSL